MKGVFNHEKEMKELKQSYDSCNEYNNKRKLMELQLTDSNRQFKKVRIDKKVENTKQRYNNEPNPNSYERRTGQTLTPLICGKVRIFKCKRKHNHEAMRRELIARGLAHKITNKTKYRDMQNILKEDEGGSHYFTPLTDYNAFKWLSSHFDADDNVIATA